MEFDGAVAELVETIDAESVSAAEIESVSVGLSEIVVESDSYCHISTLLGGSQRTPRAQK